MWLRLLGVLCDRFWLLLWLGYIDIFMYIVIVIVRVWLMAHCVHVCGYCSGYCTARVYAYDMEYGSG